MELRSLPSLSLSLPLFLSLSTSVLLFPSFLPLLSSTSSFSSSPPRRSHSFLRLVEKSSVVNGNSGFIVPRQTMPGNIIKTFRRNILTLTHRFTVRQTFRSSTPLRLRPPPLSRLVSPCPACSSSVPPAPTRPTFYVRPLFP